MKLVQLLFLAFALPMFLSMHLFSLTLVVVSTFPHRYYGGNLKNVPCLAPSSCSLFLLPLFLFLLLLLCPLLCFVLFPDTLPLPLLLGMALSHTKGKASGFPASSEEAAEALLERPCSWDGFRGSSSTLPTGICFLAAACSSVVKDFCAWQIKLCMYIAAFF